LDREIVWTKEALTNFQKVVEYLQLNWSVKVAEEFIEIVGHRVQVLTSFPMIGVSSKKKSDLRKFVLTQHNMLVYRIRVKRIILLNIYDTRQDPVKIDE